MSFATVDPLFSNGVHVTLAILLIVLVKVRARGGDFEIGVVTDETVLRGTCVAPLGTLDETGANVVAQMIDATSAVTQLRLETR